MLINHEARRQMFRVKSHFTLADNSPRDKIRELAHF